MAGGHYQVGDGLSSPTWADWADLEGFQRAAHPNHRDSSIWAPQSQQDGHTATSEVQPQVSDPPTSSSSAITPKRKHTRFFKTPTPKATGPKITSEQAQPALGYAFSTRKKWIILSVIFIV